MPFDITIQFISGDSLSYSVKPYRGRVAFSKHKNQIITLAYQHLGICSNEYFIKLLFGDEEKKLTEYFQRIWPMKSEEEIQHWVQSIMQSEFERSELRQIDNHRFITGDTTIHAVAVLLSEPRDQQIKRVLNNMDLHRVIDGSDSDDL